LIHAEDVVRNLTDALSDGPTVRRLKTDGREDEKVQGSLDEFGGLAQLRSSQ